MGSGGNKSLVEERRTTAYSLTWNTPIVIGDDGTYPTAPFRMAVGSTNGQHDTGVLILELGGDQISMVLVNKLRPGDALFPTVFPQHPHRYHETRLRLVGCLDTTRFTIDVTWGQEDDEGEEERETINRKILVSTLGDQSNTFYNDKVDIAYEEHTVAIRIFGSLDALRTIKKLEVVTATRCGCFSRPIDFQHFFLDTALFQNWKHVLGPTEKYITLKHHLRETRFASILIPLMGRTEELLYNHPSPGRIRVTLDKPANLHIEMIFWNVMRFASGMVGTFFV
jgi:hypothetical protein